VANAPIRTDHLIPRGVPTAAAVLGQAGAENFPVASRLLPAGVRSHLMAVYGFARLADDIGDEAEGDRLAMLDWLDGELIRAAGGAASHPLLVRLTSTIHACRLPLDPFQRLIEANRRDQIVHEYDTFDGLLEYCELSANPVGELVLRIFEVATPERLALSDTVCTGLQLVEHLQDVGEDARAGRVYLPAEDLARFECTPDDLMATSASPRLRALVRFEGVRSRRFLDAGGALASSLSGRVRLAVAGFAAGGHAALDAIEQADGDVLGVRCRPRPGRVLARLGTVLSAGATIRRHRRGGR
jgi:squalene synthase HpnC